MTITFNDDEVNNILTLLQRYKEITAEIKTPPALHRTVVPATNKSGALLLLAKELEASGRMEPIPSPQFATIKREQPEPIITRQKRTPKSKRGKAITAEDKTYFRSLANQRCKSTASLESVCTKFGYTKSALKSHIYRSDDLQLVKGKHLPKSDIWEGASISPTTQYIRTKQ